MVLFFSIKMYCLLSRKWWSSKISIFTRFIFQSKHWWINQINIGVECLFMVLEIRGVSRRRSSGYKLLYSAISFHLNHKLWWKWVQSKAADYVSKWPMFELKQTMLSPKLIGAKKGTLTVTRTNFTVFYVFIELACSVTCFEF